MKVLHQYDRPWDRIIGGEQIYLTRGVGGKAEGEYGDGSWIGATHLSVGMLFNREPGPIRPGASPSLTPKTQSKRTTRSYRLDRRNGNGAYP